jgi:phospholipid/cholesterol/gamma-HCH transport system substrate-binding protein
MVIAQLTVFAVLSVLILTYTVFGLLKVRLTDQPFTVKVQLKNAGGIFEGAEVSYRGVKVGQVKSVELHTNGVTATLSIGHDTNIPSNAIAHVYDLSAVGEQYVDLTPVRPGPPYLHGGSEIPESRTTTPLETATVLYDLERFVDSINPRDLQIIGTEGAAALQGTGPKLRSILADTTEIVDQLSSSEDAMLHLLHNSAVLLHGAAAHSGAFDRFASSLQALSGTLARSTPTLTSLLQQAEPTTRLINSLIADNGSAITVLLGNLATLSDIQSARVPGLRSLLVAVPEFGRLAPTIVHDGTLLGAADINQSQQLCNTGLPLTNPLAARPSTLYGVQCGTGIVRGAANAPRPSSGTSANSQRAQVLGPSARTVPGGGQVGSYDAPSGLTSTSDGALLRLGTNGGQERLLGGNSWQSLLLAVTGS